MKTNFEFWFISFSLVFVRAIDAFLTYSITPDLSHEGNPLVSLANQGWTALIIANLIVVVLSIILLHYSIRFPTNSYPEKGNFSFKEFISYFLYNDQNSFYKIFFFVPYNKKVILNFCGYLFPRVFISWSLIIIFHNLGIMHSNQYLLINHDWNLWIYIYMFLIPITFFYFWKFFRIEYLKYLKSQM